MKHELIEGDKLYSIVRTDLPSNGAISAQLAHSVVEFAIKHPKLLAEWHNKSNYVCTLAINNEHQLKTLLKKVISEDVPYASFHEPDYDGELTAICIYPSGKHLVQHLKLLFASD